MDVVPHAVDDHGEPLDVGPHGVDHVVEHTSVNEDFGMDVDEEDDPDDGIHDMVEELYTAQEEGKQKCLCLQFYWKR